MTTDTLQPWNAVLHRLLDVLAASAQPFVKRKRINYRWGQHIYDDIGDNTGQYGVHGTSEATRAFAVSLAKLGHNTRYERFLIGGVVCLSDWVDKPNKSLDLCKTVKIGEWLGALVEGGGEKTRVDALVNALIAGRDASSGGWTWDPASPTDKPLLVPTLYALDGLTRLHRKYREYDDEIKTAIQYALSELRDESLRISDDREANLSFETTLYKLCEIVDIYESSLGTKSTYRAPIEELLRTNATGIARILDYKRFEYRIAPLGLEQHAFCVLPVGVMRLQAELWARSEDLEIGLDPKDIKDRLSEFAQQIYSKLRFPLSNVGSCAFAARMFSRFGETIDELISGTAYVSRQTGKSGLAEVPASPIPLDPYAKRTVREELYSATLSKENVKKVKILEQLLGGYSGAHLDLCQITQANDTPRILQVLKLDAARNTAQEEQGAKLAEEIIQNAYRVELFARYEIDDQTGLLRYRYAGQGDLLPGRVRQFLEFLKSSDETNPIVDTINQIYQNALAQAVNRVDTDHASLDELRNYFEEKRANRFWSEVSSGYASLEEKGSAQRTQERPDHLLLSFPFETLQNPLIQSERTRRAWERQFPIERAGYGHGDLNPRNILMVQGSDADTFNPVLIDFHRFGPNVLLPVDYARLEAGIQVKALPTYFEKAANEAEHRIYLTRYEKWVNGIKDFSLAESTKRISTMEVPQELARTRKCIAAIRRCYSERASPQSKKDVRGYFGVLMLTYLSYLRPIYLNALTDRQRQFAFYCAANIFTRHFLYPAAG